MFYFNILDGDHDSGVDENTQHPAGESPTKKVGSGGAATRIPKKTPPVSPTKPSTRSRAPGAIGAGRVPRSKSVPKPFTSWATPPSTSDSAKKGKADIYESFTLKYLAIILFTFSYITL
jgi:hypothetical protein